MSRWELLGVVAGAAGYVVVVGGVTNWLRFTAADVPADQALVLLTDRELFTLGVRSLVVVGVLAAVVLGAAEFVGRHRDKSHDDHWRALKGVPTTGADEALPRALGINAVIFSALTAIGAGGLAQLIPLSDLALDIAVAVVVALVFSVLCWLLTRYGPRLLKWPSARRIAVVVVLLLALVSVLWLALLIVSSVLIALFARRLMGRGRLVRSPLPYVLVASYTVAIGAGEVAPPVSFPRAVVATADATRVGGYVARDDDGVHLVTCRPTIYGGSDLQRLTLLPGDRVQELRLGGPEFVVDSGERASPLRILADLLELRPRDLTLLSPGSTRRVPTCAADEPQRNVSGLGPGIIGDPGGGGSRPRSEPLLDDDGTPSALAALARRYQPTLHVTVEDRFWPVALSTVFLEENGTRQTCLRRGRSCVEGVSLEQLRAGAATSDYFDLPEPVKANAQKQFEAFMRGSGVEPAAANGALEHDPARLDPWATAQMYVHFAGRQDLRSNGEQDPYRGVPENLLGIQYWFFYPYNYFPVAVEQGLMDRQPLAAVKRSEGRHEGDWEQVTVFFSDELIPQWLFMARHANEGAAIRWDQLSFDGQHPIVQAAFGGHPTYPAGCGPRPRKFTHNHLTDYLSCGSGRFAFRGARTPLANLGRAPWACWRGRFGERGPRAPLRQPPNGGVCKGNRHVGEREITEALAAIDTDGGRKP